MLGINLFWEEIGAKKRQTPHIYGVDSRCQIHELYNRKTKWNYGHRQHTRKSVPYKEGIGCPAAPCQREHVNLDRRGAGHRLEHGNGPPEEASQEDESEPGRRVGFQGHGTSPDLKSII